jgi:uncharacterized heparinase superfamily protein
LTAERLVNWMIGYTFAYETADDDFLEKFSELFYKQYQHLIKVIESGNAGDVLDRFSCLWGIIMVQCHIHELYNEVEFDSCIQLLKGAIDDQCLNDGGIFSRNFNDAINMIISLIQLSQSMQMTFKINHEWLQNRINLIIKTVSSMTHGDGDIPQIQGGILPNKKTIEKIKKLNGLRLRRSDLTLNDTKMTIFKKGQTSFIIDHGDAVKSLSPLGFEMCHGDCRMVVSCGQHLIDQLWQESLNGMAAFSCLMINDTEPKKGQLQTKGSFETMNGASIFSGSHNGYNADYGLNHTRRIYIDKAGHDVRGEDILVRNIALKPLSFTIRFHLHPNVRASLNSDKTSVIIKMKNGAGWIFQINMGEIALEESVYCADGLNMRKTLQIVVRGAFDDNATQIKWAFKKQ